MDISLAIFSLNDEQPLKVLVVDDDEDNRLLLTYQLLQLVTCSVLSAEDGETALTIAHTSQPDLILLDMMMPGLDGFEVVRRLRQDPKTQEIPVIAVTAMARSQDQDLALQAGCDDFLPKPYELEHLAALLSLYLHPSCLSPTEKMS